MTVPIGYDFGVGTARARDIVEKLNERYRSARTYSDAIAYRNVTTREGETSVSTARARTVWVAPDRLLFELHDDPTEFFEAKRLALWTPRPGVVKSLFLGSVRDDESIDSGLYRLQGVSHGLTGLVPRCLLEGGFLGGEQFELKDDVDHFVLEGTFDPEWRVTFAVDARDYALRRAVIWKFIRPEPLSRAQMEKIPEDIREEVLRQGAKPFESESTIDYTPAFDAPIDAAVFDLEVSAPRR